MIKVRFCPIFRRATNLFGIFVTQSNEQVKGQLIFFPSHGTLIKRNFCARSYLLRPIIHRADLTCVPSRHFSQPAPTFKATFGKTHTKFQRINFSTKKPPDSNFNTEQFFSRNSAAPDVGFSVKSFLDIEGTDLCLEERNLAHLLARGQIPPLETFVSVIEKRLERQHSDGVLEILELLWELDIPLGIDFYQYVLGALFSTESFDPIFNLLEIIANKEGMEGFILSSWIFRSAVEGGEIDLAKRSFAFMFYKGYVRKNETFLGFLSILKLHQYEVLFHCVNPRQLQTLFKEFTRRESVDEIMNLSSLILEMGLTLEKKHYDTIIPPLIQKAPKIAIKLFELMKSSPSTAPTKKTYYQIIKGLLVDHNQFDDATEIMKQIPEHCTSSSSASAIGNLFLTAHLRFRPLESSIAFYENLIANQEPDVITFTVVINHLSKFKILAHSPAFEPTLDKVIEDMRRFHILPDLLSYSLLFKCYLRVNPQRAEELYEEMVGRGIKPDGHVYSMFIVYCATIAKSIPKALAWLRQQVDAGLTPVNKPVSDLHVLIKKADDVPSVRELQELLRRSNFLPCLDDHIERFVARVTSGEIHVPKIKNKVRWKKAGVSAVHKYRPPPPSFLTPA